MATVYVRMLSLNVCLVVYVSMSLYCRPFAEWIQALLDKAILSLSLHLFWASLFSTLFLTHQVSLGNQYYKLAIYINHSINHSSIIDRKEAWFTADLTDAMPWQGCLQDCKQKYFRRVECLLWGDYYYSQVHHYGSVWNYSLVKWPGLLRVAWLRV